MALVSTNDLEYQPKTENSSFIDTKSKKRFKLKLFSILLLITTLILLLLGYFLALNYFRVISLSQISPFFEILPISSYEVKDIVKNNTNEKVDEIITTGNNNFLLEGTLVGFDKESIIIKSKNGRTLIFEFNIDSIIRTSSNNSDILFTSDIFKNENINKNVIIDFIKNNNKNIITRIEI